jgi:hypothetical protein
VLFSSAWSFSVEVKMWRFFIIILYLLLLEIQLSEEFEDTKSVAEQTTQWPTEKGNKDKQRSTKHRKLKIEQHEPH